MFYVYEWFIKETNEIIYVGKGCRNRYKCLQHNRIFKEFIKRFNCESRIIKYFDNEKDAFLYEYERIEMLKQQGQCVCNIYKGGSGGHTFWWTHEMREKYSTYNIMKCNDQRNRMSLNNPMKNLNIKNKVREQRYRKVIINGVSYKGVKIAARILGVSENTIMTWCKRGYDTQGNPCRYANEPQKDYPVMKKTHPKVATFKAVLVNGKHFDTVKEAAEYIGVWSETLIRAIKANRTCKGYNCKYDNQQPSYTNIGKSSIEGSTTNR